MYIWLVTKKTTLRCDSSNIYMYRDARAMHRDARGAVTTASCVYVRVGADIMMHYSLQTCIPCRPT